MIMSKVNQMFWQYDLWKTKQEFEINIAGIMAELEFMSKKPETSEVWKKKALFVES